MNPGVVYQDAAVAAGCRSEEILVRDRQDELRPPGVGGSRGHPARPRGAAGACRGPAPVAELEYHHLARDKLPVRHAAEAPLASLQIEHHRHCLTHVRREPCEALEPTAELVDIEVGGVQAKACRAGLHERAPGIR